MWWFATVALADTCDAWDAPLAVTAVRGSSVTEASGLAASRARPGTFYTHGDRGSAAVLVAFDDHGLLDEHLVVDATNTDWEDLAAAPCPDDGDCLYVGDIGDNDEARASVTVWVVREPDPKDDTVRTIARYDATYPDGPHDAETLLVHPCTGRLYLVTKADDGLAGVYRFPSGGSGELELVGQVQIDAPTASGRALTGGDWDADGDRVVLRSGDRLFEWATDPAAPDAHWSAAPTVLVGTLESQGEGVAYGLDGDLYTTGEGSPVPLDRYPCADPAPAADPACVFPQTGRSCGCSGGGAPLGWSLGAGWVLALAPRVRALRRRPTAAR